MAQRGRKSAASLAIVASLNDVRPEPPPELTGAQAAEWRAVTAALPAGWFRREQYGLLAAYCQHASAARLLAMMIDSFQAPWLADPDGLARYDKLLAMRERETKSMASLATKMRLTQQARYMPNAAARATANSRTSPAPWEGSEIEAGR